MAAGMASINNLVADMAAQDEENMDENPAENESSMKNNSNSNAITNTKSNSSNNNNNGNTISLTNSPNTPTASPRAIPPPIRPMFSVDTATVNSNDNNESNNNTNKKNNTNNNNGNNGGMADFRMNGMSSLRDVDMNNMNSSNMMNTSSNTNVNNNNMNGISKHPSISMKRETSDSDQSLSGMKQHLAPNSGSGVTTASTATSETKMFVPPSLTLTHSGAGNESARTLSTTSGSRPSSASHGGLSGTSTIPSLSLSGRVNSSNSHNNNNNNSISQNGQQLLGSGNNVFGDLSFNGFGQDAGNFELNFDSGVGNGVSTAVGKLGYENKRGSDSFGSTERFTPYNDSSCGIGTAARRHAHSMKMKQQIKRMNNRTNTTNNNNPMNGMNNISSMGSMSEMNFSEMDLKQLSLEELRALSGLTANELDKLNEPLIKTSPRSILTSGIMGRSSFEKLQRGTGARSFDFHQQAATAGNRNRNRNGNRNISQSLTNTTNSNNHVNTNTNTNISRNNKRKRGGDDLDEFTDRKPVFTGSRPSITMFDDNLGTGGINGPFLDMSGGNNGSEFNFGNSVSNLGIGARGVSGDLGLAGLNGDFGLESTQNDMLTWNGGVSMDNININNEGKLMSATPVSLRGQSGVFDTLDTATMNGLSNMGDMSTLANLNNLNNLNNFNDLNNMSDLNNLGNLGNMNDFSNLTNLGNLGNLSNMPNMSDIANMGGLMRVQSNGTGRKNRPRTNDGRRNRMSRNMNMNNGFGDVNLNNQNTRPYSNNGWTTINN